MSDFNLLRDRDAWSTIRGFVYQIDLSILQWLKLKADQILELERGEDIDLVRQLISPDCDEPSRILGQIKHREGSITIRSQESLYALACFHEHLRTNPSDNLVFRFITNARAGRERPSPFVPKEAGIIIWRKFAAGTLSKTNKRKFLTGVRTIINNAPKPDDLTDAAWLKFKNDICDDSSLINIINRFEWSTEEVAAVNLPEIIITEILAQNYSSEQSSAKSLYFRLFLHVSKLLSKPGIKRLTHNDRIEILKSHDAVLQERDSKLLTSIQGIINFVAQDLKEQLDANIQNVEILSKRVEDLTTSYGFSNLRDLNYVPPNLAIDELPDGFAQRAETVASLIKLIKKHTWLIVSGGRETGKTSLGVLVAKKLDPTAIWFRLQTSYDNAERATAILQAGFWSSTGIRFVTNRAAWYLEVFRKFGSGRLIVLDDVPRFTHNDLLAEELRLIAEACEKTNNFLLVFTLHPIAANSIKFNKNKNGHAVSIPQFSYKEIKELSTLHGAPDAWLADNYAGFLARLTDQHAAILAAFVEYLAAQSWNLTKDAFDALISKKPANELLNTIIYELGNTIHDVQVRGLLYRASLFTGAFSDEDVVAVASISPEINEPRLCFQKIVGPWVQKLSADEYVVSPLVRNLGSTELSSSIREAVHGVISDRLLNTSTLDQYSVHKIIGHLYQSRQHNRVGALLLWTLMQIEKENEATSSTFLLFLWPEALPNEMKLDLRILIRAYQIKLLNSINLSISKQVNSLIELCKQTDADSAWSVIVAVAMVGKNIIDTCGIIDFIKLYARSRSLVKAENFPSDFNNSCQSLIWHHIRRLTNLTELEAWLDVIEGLTPEERIGIKETTLYEDTALVLADQYWMWEANKKPEDRNWSAVLAILKVLASRSRTLDLEVLWASAIRAEIIVHAEYMKDIKTAIFIAESALASAPDDSHARFLIKECIGRQHEYMDSPDKGKIWLDSAYQENRLSDSFSVIRLHFLLEVAEQHSQEDTCITMAKEAVEVGQKATLLSRLELVRALSGLAVAYFKRNKQVEAFDSFDESATKLLACQKDTPQWKEAYFRLGQMIGACTHIARFGHTPIEPAGRPVSTPEITSLIRLPEKHALAAHFVASQQCFLMAQLATFGAAVQRYERAAAWATKAFELASVENQNIVIATTGPMGIINMLLGDRFVDAIDLALSVGKSMAIVREFEDNIQNSNVTEDALGVWPNERWLFAESSSAQTVVIVALARIASLNVDQSNTALTKTAELIRVVTEVSTHSMMPELWESLANILNNAVIDPIELPLVHELIKKCMDKQKSAEMRDLIHAGGYLLASISSRANLENSCKLQSVALDYVLKNQYFTDANNLLLFPFFEAFWRKAFTEQRFAFAYPRLTQSGFHEIEGKSGNEKILGIFDAICGGLQITLPANLNSYTKK